jgi:ATP-dependent exoDNAse (exonuclease V) beta subunit
MIHKVLEKINTVSDIKPTLHRFVISGMISNLEMKNIYNIIEQIITHSELTMFFHQQNEILCESTILLPMHEALRPDRIAIFDNKLYLLDYKTGEKQKEDAAQLNRYAEVFEKMGYEVVEKKIAYIQNENIEIETVV